MCDLGARQIERSHRLGRATRRRNLVQNADRSRAENDDALRTPGASPSHHDIGDILGGSSGDLDSLQLVRSEETNRPAVGRPEWAGTRMSVPARGFASSESSARTQSINFPFREDGERELAAIR